MSEKKEAATPGRKVAKVVTARAHDYQTVFSTEQGRRVLHDLISTHHVMGTTFDPDRPAVQAFREGERNVVLRIFTLLKLDPAKVQKLIQESDRYAEILQDGI